MHKKVFHIVNISIMLIMVIYMEFTGQLGLSALGTCSVKFVSPISFLPIGLYLVLSLFTLYYIKKRLPDAESTKKLKSQMIQ